MRRVVLSLALISGLAAAAAAPVFADEPAKPDAAPAAKPAKPAKDDPERVVCTREHVVGSNRPQRICMTVGERQRLKDAAARATDEGRRPGQQSPGTIMGGG